MNARIDVSKLYLPTKSFILRPWTLDDLEDFYSFARDPDVGPRGGWEAHASKRESEDDLVSFIRSKNNLALEFKGRVIGYISLVKYREDDYPDLEDLMGREIDCALSKAYWGQGLMAEALKSIISWAFRDRGLDFLLYAHFDWNYQSQRLGEKCGFTYMDSYFEDIGDRSELIVERILYKKNWENKKFI